MPAQAKRISTSTNGCKQLSCLWPDQPHKRKSPVMRLSRPAAGLLRHVSGLPSITRLGNPACHRRGPQMANSLATVPGPLDPVESLTVSSIARDYGLPSVSLWPWATEAGIEAANYWTAARHRVPKALTPLATIGSDITKCSP